MFFSLKTCDGLFGFFYGGSLLGILKFLLKKDGKEESSSSGGRGRGFSIGFFEGRLLSGSRGGR